jgi:trimeric autotransporter adhesin
MFRSICALLALLFTLALPSLSTSCAEPIRPTLDLTQSAESLVVKPPEQPARSGQSLQLTVKRRFPGGQLEDVTARVAYTVEKGIAEVSDRGLVTAGSEPGPVIVRVFDPSSDATALASIIVVEAKILTIEITPAPARVLVRGESQPFTATARFNNGDITDVTRSVSWSSTDESVALVGNTSFDKGIVRAVSPGNATILATDGLTLVQGRSIVFVPAESVLLQAIVVTPNPAVVGVGKTLQLRADGIYSDGSTRDLTRGVPWTSSRGDVVAVDTLGLIGGVIVGDATITAGAPDATSTIKGSAAAKVVP